MFTPEEWRAHKVPTIIVGHSGVENIDPLDETWLAFEGILRQLFNSGQIVYDDDLDIDQKDWPVP